MTFITGINSLCEKNIFVEKVENQAFKSCLNEVYNGSLYNGVGGSNGPGFPTNLILLFTVYINLPYALNPSRNGESIQQGIII